MEERYFKITLTSPDGTTIYESDTDFGIAEGSMALDEILCTNGIELGAYNSNKFEVKVFSIDEDVSGYTITVQDYGTSQTVPKPIFEGIVDSSVYDSDGGYRDIVAYDAMYGARDVDIGPQWQEYWGKTTERIANGDFEEDFVGQADTAPGWTNIRGGVIEGSGISGRCLHLNYSGGTALVQQGVHLDEGIDYTLTFWHKGGDYAKITVVLPGGGSANYNIRRDETFTKHTIDIPAPADTGLAIIKIQSMSGGTTTGDSYFDAFSMAGNALQLKQIRNMICSFVDLQTYSGQVALPNDTAVFRFRNHNQGEYLVPDLTSVKFSVLLKSLCELQSCCPNMNRQGRIEFIRLPHGNLNASTYVDDPIYIGVPDGGIDPLYEKGSSTFEDYITASVSGFSIYATSGSEPQDCHYNTHNNCMVLSGNLFLGANQPDEVATLMSEVSPNLVHLRYRPAEIKMIVSTFDTKLGDTVTTGEIMYQTSSYTQYVTQYVLAQSYSGSLLIEQTINSPAIGQFLNQDVSKENDSLVENLRNRENVSNITDMQTEIKRVASVSMTDESVNVLIQERLMDVNSVKTETGFTFNEEGLRIKKTDSPTETVVTENGMAVESNSQKVLTANDQGVDARNLHATTYLIVGQNSRFEDYGFNRTGCFALN